MSALASRFPPRFLPALRPSLLAALISAAMAAPAGAGTVPPAGSHTVNPGDPVEAWDMGAGATLIVNPGAETLHITANTGAALLRITGGTVTGGRNQNVIQIVGTGFAEITNSLLSGDSGISHGRGASSDPAAGGLLIRDSRVLVGTSRHALALRRVNAQVIGSELVGGSFGVTMDEDPLLTVDSSIIRGKTGAIRAFGDARILLRNGSQLFSDDGTILSVFTTVSKVDFVVDDSDLVGNLDVAPPATADVTLRNNATLLGRMFNVTALTLQDGGRWTLNGASNVGTLTLGSGSSVHLGNGTGFNTLTVHGDLIGNGGTLVFNTELGNDASPTDRVVVEGATQGQAHVAVNHVGGTGAPTVNGIALIQTTAPSAGTFVLDGRVVAGIHEYVLVQGTPSNPGDGNWYLSSSVTAPPGDPCVGDPSLPGCTPTDPEDPVGPGDPVDPEEPEVPLLRPEPGAYLANQLASLQMFNVRFHDRRGGTLGPGGRSGWARFASYQTAFRAVAGQLDARGDAEVLQLGADVLTWGDASRGRVGVTVGSGRFHTQSTSRGSGYHATGRVHGSAAGVYASWQQTPGEATGPYLDAIAQYARFNNRVRGDILAEERYRSHATLGSLEAGYGLAVVDTPHTEITLQPQVQLTYSNLRQSRHVEQNGTWIDAVDSDGMGGRLGLRLSGQGRSASVNQVRPHLEVNWIRGAALQALRFDDEALEGGLPRNRHEVRGGVELMFGPRWNAWGSLTVQRGDADYRDTSAQVGVSANW